MSARRGLPFVAADIVDIEDHLRDRLLRGAIAESVECLEHSASSRTLLGCQSRVWRHGAMMKRREQAFNRLQTVEAGDVERDDRNQRCDRRRIADLDELERWGASVIYSEICADCIRCKRRR